jgi:GNAT superfamily N-acetyltransferase
MHVLTRFREHPFNDLKLANALGDMIERGKNRYVLLVAESAEQRIVGVMIGVLEQHIFSDHLVASVMHYDVLPEARMGGYGVRLLKAFEQWAKNRQVGEINFGVNSGDESEAVGRFAQKMGFTKVGENFVKNVG